MSRIFEPVMDISKGTARTRRFSQAQSYASSLLVYQKFQPRTLAAPYGA